MKKGAIIALLMVTLFLSGCQLSPKPEGIEEVPCSKEYYKALERLDTFLCESVIDMEPNAQCRDRCIKQVVSQQEVVSQQMRNQIIEDIQLTGKLLSVSSHHIKTPGIDPLLDPLLGIKNTKESKTKFRMSAECTHGWGIVIPHTIIQPKNITVEAGEIGIFKLEINTEDLPADIHICNITIKTDDGEDYAKKNIFVEKKD